MRFVEDGRIELDTNSVERARRPIALSRKNSLFAGHDEGAANWAFLASLIESCKLNSVDPQAYLAEVLTKLVNLWPSNRLDELNAAIAQDTTNLGPGYCIGHSFFCPAESIVPDALWYREVIETEIVPLLEEYWFDYPDKVKEWRERLLAEL